MLRLFLASFGILIAVTSLAQQPPSGDQADAVNQAQIRASAAYNELREAQYQSKLAEQDYINTQDAYRTAQKAAEDLKRELDKTKKALDAAKAKEVQSRKAYDAALDEVDKAWGRPRQNR